MSSSHQRINHIIDTVTGSPDDINQLNQLAGLLIQQQQFDDAIHLLKKIIIKSPQFSLAYYNLAIVYQQQHQYDQAIAYFEQAHQISPQNDHILAAFIYLLMRTLDWPRIKTLTPQLEAITLHKLANHQTPAENPFLHLTRTSHQLEINRQIAHSWSQAAKLSLPEFHHPPKSSSKPIKLAYLSSDFRDHGTTHALIPILTHHQRANFHITAYSVGPDDHSEYRQDIQHLVDSFLDCHTLTNDQLATQINQDHIDILIDLNGHSQGNRLGALSLRPAPIIISFLGVPGTTGAPYVDYLIADHTVIPQKDRQYYTESIAFMPGCYYPTYPEHHIHLPLPKKSQYQLPNNKIIFGSLLNAYKLDPDTLSLWCRIVTGVPESILWLLVDNPRAQANLLKFAKQNGLNPDRIFFTSRIPKAEHLSRHHLIDVYLDTIRVSGHSSSVDALLMQRPIVTLQGHAWMSLVTTSLLKACKLDELIAPNPKTYESLAIRLATNHKYRQSLAKKLFQIRKNGIIFDMSDYTKKYEALLTTIWHRHQQQLPRTDIN